MYESIYNNNEEVKQIIFVITLHKSSANNLSILVESALELNQICTEHVEAYARKYFSRKKLVKPQLSDFNNLKKFREMIENAVEESD